jgi:hypothetical protein
VARQVIDLGTSPNRGDGDPLRTAFDKVNDNFAELYAGNFASPTETASNLIPDADAIYNLGSADNQWADLHVADFIYLGGARLEVDASNNLRVDGVAIAADTQGSVFADDSTLLVDAVNGNIVGPVKTTDVQTLYLRNNPDDAGPDLLIYADNSVNIQYAAGDILLGNATGTTTVHGTLDVTNTTFSGEPWISLADLKTVVAASIDFNDFQTRIAAL